MNIVGYTLRRQGESIPLCPADVSNGRYTTKWIEMTSQNGVSSTATASAQFAGRAVQLSRNVRQSDHIFVNEIAGHKVKRGPGAGEEWLAATKHDWVDVESILVNQTQVR